MKTQENQIENVYICGGTFRTARTIGDALHHYLTWYNHTHEYIKRGDMHLIKWEHYHFYFVPKPRIDFLFNKNLNKTEEPEYLI